jgi:hypothetical protein
METIYPPVMIMKHDVFSRMQWPIFLQPFIWLDTKPRSDFNINVCHREKIEF